MALTPALRQTLSPIGERGTMQYANIFFMHPAFPHVKIDQFERPYDELVELAKNQKERYEYGFPVGLLLELNKEVRLFYSLLQKKRHRHFLFRRGYSLKHLQM